MFLSLNVFDMSKKHYQSLVYLISVFLHLLVTNILSSLNFQKSNFNSEISKGSQLLNKRSPTSLEVLFGTLISLIFLYQKSCLLY